MQLKDLTPINGQVIVIDKRAKDKTESGIIIPETATQDQIIEGLVLNISSEKDSKGNLIEPEVKEGDVVLYSLHAGAGNTFTDDKGMNIRIVRQVEILAKIIE